MRLGELPPVDQEPRVLLRERALARDLDEAAYGRGEYEPVWSLPPDLTSRVESTSAGIAVTFRSESGSAPRFEKRYLFQPGGTLVVEYRWDPGALGGDTVFAPELSYNGPLELECEPATTRWSYDIVTVAKSEKALEQTVQGHSVTPRWPATAREARLILQTRPR
jgi:hypothetical protein